MDLCQYDLDKWFQINSRNCKKCIQIISQICFGFNCIHSEGMIHGEIKPSNIFIDPDGICKIGN